MMQIMLKFGPVNFLVRKSAKNLVFYRLFPLVGWAHWETYRS